MEKRKEFDYFIDQLFDSAVQSFRATDEYSLHKEKLDRMDNDCETMFTKEEQYFAMQCFDLLLDVSGQEQRYVYHQAMLDCVTILKSLGVLA